MSKHTPGPWKANFAISGSVYIFGGDRNFACVFDEWRDEANQEANANLIAAAPDLLEALEELLSMCQRQEDFHDDDDGCMFERASAAIAKARGEK